MIDEGDDAPDFTVPLANGDVDSFTLSDRLDEAPLVLAFFPAAFTGTCRTEMGTFQDRLDAFEDAGATVYGISADTPFALNAFREQNGLRFGLLSDFEKEVIDAYDVRSAFAELGVHGVPKRAVVVVNGDGVVSYAWSSDDMGVEPDYDAVEDAARAAD